MTAETGIHSGDTDQICKHGGGGICNVHSTLALYLFYLKTITSELHNSKSMHFSQVTVMYIVGMGQLEPGTGTKFSYITEITGTLYSKTGTHFRYSSSFTSFYTLFKVSYLNLIIFI